MLHTFNRMNSQVMLLSDYVDTIRVEANRNLDERHRGDLGQFMTPAPTARLLASMLTLDAPSVSLLDAGAGVGSLLSAAVEVLCLRDTPPQSIHVTAYEIEPRLLPYLQQTLELCRQSCETVGCAFASTIIAKDFVLDVVDQLTSPLFANHQIRYNAAILNPPYRKIQTGSLHRSQLRRVGVETSNLYAGFLALAIMLLDEGGELVSITPRSFCNGPYFRPFRQFLLRSMAVRRFHVFHSRYEAFGDDQVLQENVIVSAVKSTVSPTSVTVSSSIGPDDVVVSFRELPFTQFTNPRDPEHFFHLLPDDSAAKIAATMRQFTASLSDLGLEVSTGRVVDFRAAEHLRAEPAHDTAPLIYPLHLHNGGVVWPRSASKKPNALRRCSETESLLIPNETYVLVKRFSSKEERRRLVAAVLEPSSVPGPVVAIENHVNYFHTGGRGIEPAVAHGLAIFLNSTLVDEFLRQFNGHTQVNATDLRNIRYPTREQLKRLGEHSHLMRTSQEALDELIAQEIGSMTDNFDNTPILIKQRLEEALTVLKLLDFPRAQQNERSALVLLSLLDLTPEKPWAHASDPYRGITPMMEFFAEHYGKHYKPNTRETVRRQTVHQFLDAGIIVANPDEPARPVNSPKAVYQIEPAALELLRTYGTPDWDACSAERRSASCT
jgi:adenine-specific DNA-methyltransferase